MSKFYKITKNLVSATALCGVIASVSLVSITSDAVAADKKERKYANRKTKKVQSLPVKLSKDFAKAQECMEGEDGQSTENVQCALNILNKWAAKGDKLKPYAMAQVNNFYGYIYASQENFPQAIKAYEKVLNQRDLNDEGITNQTLFVLAQLYLTQSKFQKTVDYMKRWLANQDEPSTTAMMTIAKAYYSLGAETKSIVEKNKQFKYAIPYIEDSIRINAEKGKDDKENWFSLLRVMHFELKNYPRVMELLQIMVEKWPKKSYWVEMAGISSELSNGKGLSKKAAVKHELNQMLYYEVAHRQGMLQKSGELMNMAQMYQFHETPYRATSIITKGFKNKRIKEDKRNLESLSQAYLASQEYDKALKPLLAAAEIEKTSKLYLRYGYVCLQLYKYECAVKYINKALVKGDLPNPEGDYLSKGMAEVNLKRFKAAEASFKYALKHKKTKKTARSWLRNLEIEKARWEQVKKYLR